jgi:serine/threonine protein kinase
MTNKLAAREAASTVAIKSPRMPTPATPSEERDPLDLIAEEFADLCRRGKTPSVTDFLVKYPLYAEDLRDLLPAVGQMESLKKLRKASGSGLYFPVEPMPEHIGDYKILREIGRGGMGVVYEAEQASLGRRVAVKILPLPARNEPEKRERFLREAQAAARLHHTHIVPVFGVGEDNGMPYYVMQLIRGCGLDDVIHGWKNPGHSTGDVLKPNDWKAIVRLVAEAAEALDYAHSEGILHRDVKPGNLLLDPAGHLWVTDFGLAKLMNEGTLTATGHVLGTLQYMAPENLSGESDARTDVYGLGMVLYELLTGRLPFDETNPAILVKQIGAKDPPPPRLSEPKVPRDLETICLKAVAREAGRRYARAGDLAEDLRAYLVGRSISARRMSPVGKAWLWCKRNPAVAGSLAATALVLAGSAAFGWSMYGKARAALANETELRNKEAKLLEDKSRLLATETKLRKEAVAAYKKYDASLHLSLQSLEKILDEVASFEMPPGGPNGGPNGVRREGPPDGRGPEGRPQFDGRPTEGEFPPKGLLGGNGPLNGPRGNREAMTNNAKVLQQILAFFEKFAETNSTEPKLKFDAARAYRKVGEIHITLGDERAGSVFIDKAVTLFKELLDTHPEPDRVRFELDLIKKRSERRRLP